MKGVHVTQNLMVKFRSEHEVDSLALLFHRTDIAMLGVQPAHTRDWIIREVH
jgi:hypothetical protein